MAQMLLNFYDINILLSVFFFFFLFLSYSMIVRKHYYYLKSQAYIAKKLLNFTHCSFCIGGLIVIAVVYLHFFAVFCRLFLSCSRIKSQKRAPIRIICPTIVDETSIIIEFYPAKMVFFYGDNNVIKSSSRNPPTFLGLSLSIADKSCQRAEIASRSFNLNDFAILVINGNVNIIYLERWVWF